MIKNERGLNQPETDSDRVEDAVETGQFSMSSDSLEYLSTIARISFNITLLSDFINEEDDKFRIFHLIWERAMLSDTLRELVNEHVTRQSINRWRRALGLSDYYSG